MTLQSAVIGAGTVSQVHLSGLDDCPRTELVAVCDIDEERATEVARDYGIDAYTDVDELLAAADLDWVHVCTSVQTHLPLARKAIEAGVPVLIEKPVTETIEEAEELAETARQHGVRVAVVHQHLYDPAMRKALAQIRDGDLGAVRGVDVVFTGLTAPDEKHRGSWAFDLPGGEFEEGFPHPLYLALGVGGYPVDGDSVQAVTTLVDDYGGEFAYDNVQVQYASEGDALCSVKMLSGTVPQRVVHVHGEEKSLTVDLTSQTLVELPRNYRGSSINRALNNVDRVVDRIGGTVENATTVAKGQFDAGWEHQRTTKPHYYLIDAEAEAIADGAGQSESLARAVWATRITETIRDTTREERPAAVQ
ncbi:Gfo/Idh/MocA family protein [Halostella litorea]|uniref:Gfo/Idh/MocA family protein n=1 Tax=Halostella litorea TaxID=2528831 RepID=UPI001091F08A|nr:Gfo/Idh/MocA family oxidoreductase [Halostella litorea]